MRKYIPCILAVFLVINGLGQSKSDTQDSIYESFVFPPRQAAPRVWWHWMNGNITKDGIQKDLDWMERTGIGGFQNFDASLFTPVVVPRKLVFMTPEWKEAFRFATELADKKGLEMAIAGSPGWSVTGGPWVEPKDAMKKYVWTETRVEGGHAVSIHLPQPPDVPGKFQNIKIASGGIMGGFIGQMPAFYQDAAVIAYRIPEKEQTLKTLNPKVSSSGGIFSLDLLTDGDLDKSMLLPPMEVGQDMWIQFEFNAPQTFKALAITGASHSALEEFTGAPENRSLQVSDDGISFREIARIPGSTVPNITVSFAPVSAKYWRIAIRTLPAEANPFAAMTGVNSGPPKPEGVNVAEIVLYNTSHIHKVEEKAGFSPWREDGKLGTGNPESGKEDAISTEDVIDLTSKMNADGTLNWTAPPGNWNVVRFGYSLTGRQNHPASPEATGLEVDKLDKEAVRKYINTYLDMYKDATGGKMGARGLQYMVLDSYEAGHMTWTKDLPAEFQKRRGYNIITWLPVLTGRVIKSVEASESFLWDFRKTIGELIAENHYDLIGDELHKRGMKRYTESHEDKRIYLADGMDVKRNADIPMSAMWTQGGLTQSGDEEVRSEGDIRESASVANIYGKPFVAAESMTSIGNGFHFYPERLKRTADLEMASGLNRFVIHTSVHQPLDDKKPGFSLGPFGQYFTRQETWAGQARAWIDYLGRSSYMLQQGRNIADILYYYGENTNITWVCREKLPDIPAGYEFDFVNATALINAIRPAEGQLVAQSGNQYKLLMLDESAKFMTLPVLKKIKGLVDGGVKIIGERPVKSPSLSDDDAAFQKLADEIWKHQNVSEHLQANSLPQPDIIITNTKNKILFRHRQTDDRDIYWLDNRSENPTTADISFRISGKIPVKWNPLNGEIQKVSYQISDGRTTVPLKFESWDAFFIVFKDAAIQNSYSAPETIESIVSTITGPWKVIFNGREERYNELKSWSESQNPDIKYFSGTASYQNSFKIDKLSKDVGYEIDLGGVKNIAEVFLNGIPLGITWKTPFKVNATRALKIGNNTLEIRVTNLWVNRLIGDAQPDVKQKTTFTTMPFYQANSPLLPSGLLGPVKIISVSGKK